MSQLCSLNLIKPMPPSPQHTQQLLHFPSISLKLKNKRASEPSFLFYGKMANFCSVCRLANKEQERGKSASLICNTSNANKATCCTTERCTTHVQVTAKTLGQVWYALRFLLFVYWVMDDIYCKAHRDQHQTCTSSGVYPSSLLPTVCLPLPERR